MRNQLLSILQQVTLPLLPIFGFSQLTLAAAFPSPVVPCPLTGNESETFLTLDEVTVPIVHELQRRFGNLSGNGIDMAPRDSDWQVTDAIIATDPPLSFRRFVQAGHDADRWYVWYELGGIGHSYHIAIFDLPKGVEVPHLVMHTFVDHPEELCAETKAHLHDTSDTPNERHGW